MKFKWIKIVVIFWSAFLVIACKPVPKRPPQDNGGWQPLTRADWVLKSITNNNNIETSTFKSGLAANKVKLKIKRGYIEYYSGCNGYAGKIRLLPDNKLLVMNLMGSRIECKNIPRDGEIEFSNYINKLGSYEVTGTSLKPILLLTTKQNVVMKFDGELTPDTKYGRGKQFIIELNQLRKEDCVNKPCTRWREVIGNKNNIGKSFDYEKQWIPINIWNNSHPIIKNLKLNFNRKYIIQIKEYKSEKFPTGVLWVNDRLLDSTRLVK